MPLECFPFINPVYNKDAINGNAITWLEYKIYVVNINSKCQIGDIDSYTKCRLE